MISGISSAQAAALAQALDRAKPAAQDVSKAAGSRAPSDVMSFLDDVLDLGDGRSLMDALGKLSAKDAEGALQSLAKLLKAGVVGYEYRKVHGQVQKVFIDVAMGTDAARAPLARKNAFDQYV